MSALGVALALAAQGTPYTMLGHGASSCGQWTTDRQQNGIAANSDEAWLLGYVTAFNRYRSSVKNVAAGVDPDGMMVWMDNYCSRNPLDPIALAAENLVFELERRQGKHR